MNTGTFELLMRELSYRYQPFEKRHVLMTYQATMPLDSAQAYRIVEQFCTAHERLDALSIIAARLQPMSCFQATRIMNLEAFAIGKLAMLELLARLLTDGRVHTSRDIIREGFTFQTDKDRAEDILSRYHGHDPQHHRGSALGGLVGNIADIVMGDHRRATPCPPPQPVLVSASAPPPIAYPMSSAAYTPPPVAYPMSSAAYAPPPVAYPTANYVVYPPAPCTAPVPVIYPAAPPSYHTVYLTPGHHHGHYHHGHRHHC